ncbi:hypothetical protein J7T55_003765 [Diaporthe amygdali]|uniref:uncharacterized protein n=1 Tax=Phomopsis amygdali TaxID=1214568 RepID=UPI0022FE2554|nr:uncharacterized protein J7T55_003765 [Diaporthe amygdali]KAJ0117351.1 hypothetical protein J7T55_003765 [Diaporthe amygdali]
MPSTATSSQPPLSLGLLCIYKQYKADTETIAGWLKANAVKHGYKFDGQDGTAIRTSDFVPMAQQIVANVKQGGFTLHPAIHLAFRRAIVARNECTAWYEENTEGQWENNQSHAYFTNLLLTCWDILLRASTNRPKPHPRKPLPFRKEKTTQDETATARDKAFVPSNRFAALYVDAGGDDGSELDAADIQSSSLTGWPLQGKKSKSSHMAPPATIIPDETQIEEEFWFAIQSFLQEQQKVREEVKRYWQDYKGTESHLIMATFGTRMAIDLIRRSEIELGLQVKRPKRFPEHKYPVRTFPALLVGAQQRCKGSPTNLDDLVDAPLDRFVVISGPQNELTLYNTYATLKAWCFFMDHEDGFEISMEFVLNSEIRRLANKILRFGSIVEERPPYEDDITRGVREALQSGKVPIWTTFALTVLLDMEDILHNCLFIPWKDASEHVSKLFSTPPSHWHHQSDCRHLPLLNGPVYEDSPKEPRVKHKTTPASKATSMLDKVRSTEGPRKKGMMKKRLPKKKLLKEDQAEETSSCDAYLRCGYDRYEGDVFVALKWVLQATAGCQCGSDCCNAPDFDLLKMNPLHCGMIKYDIYRSRQSSALHQNTDDNRDIWTMMYIYAAGRSVFPDSLAWPDMEFLLYQQDEKYVFFGGRPTDLQWAARKWLLALGNSSAGYSYRDLGHIQCCTFRSFINYKRWRPLRDNSVLGTFISSRMNCCDVHRAAAHDNFMEMVRTMHSQDALNRLARMLDMGEDQTKAFVATWTSRLQSWTLQDILELTQMYLAVDLADVGFDWAALDSTCSEMWKEAYPLLRIKHSDARDDEDYLCSHEDCDVGSQPSTWTTVILSQAAEVEINLPSKKKRDLTVFAEELQKGSPAFMKLWSLIQEHCRKRVNASLGSGIFSSFAAEQGLIKLLDTRRETPYPARIVAPHVHKCFKGYPEELVKQSSSMILAEKILASDPGTLGGLKKTGSDTSKKTKQNL